MANIPRDPVMLLSFINMQLRDYYSGLDELCRALLIDRGELEEKLKTIDYFYDEANNRFV